MRSILFAFLLIAVHFSGLQAQVQVLSIKPESTDAGIQTIHGDHLALIDTHAPQLHKLLLMIVGTGGSARDNFSFDSLAAAKGYHVISLDYKNTVVTTVCSNSEDSTCFNRFRQEIVFGESVSPLVEVDTVNSIYHRFVALLQLLAVRYPTQYWQQYIKNDVVVWSKITVAGHSQGAGHAAYLGKKFPVARVLLFAGPQDYLAHFNTPAGWQFRQTATHPSQYFAFLHYKDPYDSKKQLADCAALMGPYAADTLQVNPFMKIKGRPHIFITGIASSNPHGAMLQPVFANAWLYLLR